MIYNYIYTIYVDIYIQTYGGVGWSGSGGWGGGGGVGDRMKGVGVMVGRWRWMG